MRLGSVLLPCLLCFLSSFPPGVTNPFIDFRWRFNIALSLVNGIWLWDKNTSVPLTYDLWGERQPSGNGECGIAYGDDIDFGFDDRPCRRLCGYICEDIHCYLL